MLEIGVYVGLSIGGIVIGFLLLIYIIWRCKRLKKEPDTPNPNQTAVVALDGVEPVMRKQGSHGQICSPETVRAQKYRERAKTIATVGRPAFKTYHKKAPLDRKILYKTLEKHPNFQDYEILEEKTNLDTPNSHHTSINHPGTPNGGTVAFNNNNSNNNNNNTNIVDNFVNNLVNSFPGSPMVTSNSRKSSITKADEERFTKLMMDLDVENGGGNALNDFTPHFKFSRKSSEDKLLERYNSFSRSSTGKSTTHLLGQATSSSQQQSADQPADHSASSAALGAVKSLTIDNV